jgi:hypothetical protein
MEYLGMRGLGKARTTLALLAVFGAFMTLSSNCPSYGDNAMFLHKVMSMEQQAKQSNNPADWMAVGNMWLNSASTDGTGNADLMARRAAACFTHAYTNAQGNAFEQDSSLGKAYGILEKLEPSNAAWPFLNGEMDAARGHYIDADVSLKKAVKLGGAGGQKAQQLLTHAATYIAQDRERYFKAHMVSDEAIQAGNAALARSRRAPIQSVGDIYNRNQAASRAFNAGDMGAQSRINAGGASNLDRNRFGSGY